MHNSNLISLNITRIKRLALEGSWIVLGQIMSFVASFVLIRVITEHLDQARLGQMALGLTVAGFINQVVMGGLRNGIVRFYSVADEKQDLGGFLQASRRLMLFATIVVVFISMLVITGLMWMGYWQWIILAAAALVYSVLSSYNSVLSGIQNAARQRAITTLNGSIDAWLKIGLALCMMFWLGNSGEAVVIGYALSSLIVTFSQILFLRRTIPVHKRQTSRNHKWMGQIWTYSYPFATWGIFGWAQQSSTRWALESFSTTETVGLFSVVYQIGYSPIQVLTATALTFLTPIIFARSGDGTSIVRKDNVRELTNKLVIFGLGITAIAVIVSALFHSYIFQLLVSESFYSVSHYLPWLVLAGGIFSVAQLYASRIMAFLLTKKIIPASIGSSIIGLAAAFVGAYYFSLTGAVMSVVIHAISYFIWIVITSRSIDKKDM